MGLSKGCSSSAWWKASESEGSVEKTVGAILSLM